MVPASAGSDTDMGAPSTRGLPAPGSRSSPSGSRRSSCVVIFLFDPRKHPIEAAAGHGRLAVPTLADLVDLQRRPAVRADAVQDAALRGLGPHRALERPVLGELRRPALAEDDVAALLVDLVVG